MNLGPSTVLICRQRQAVVDAMKHAWGSYVKYAWGHDELDPVAKRGKDGFGGVGATASLYSLRHHAQLTAFLSLDMYASAVLELSSQAILHQQNVVAVQIVDSLDTLWIMGLKEDYKRARDWVATVLDFRQCAPCPWLVFCLPVRTASELYKHV